jgi:hypothetical protein
MNLNSNRIFGLGGFALLAGASLSIFQGCDPTDGGGIPGCDLSCPVDGILEGNATITGVAEVDGFFGAIVDLSAAANGIAGTLNAEIDAIGVSLGLEPGAATADIVTALDAKLSITGGLQIEFLPPRCEASVEVAVAAAAECDASVDPGMATVQCEGGCEVEGGVMASCEGGASLTCTGPQVDCGGSCQGECEMMAAATCSGTCRGTCTNGTCSVTDAGGNCAGECTGDCQGTCELEAGGTCMGSCNGSCTIENAASCDATATAKCEAEAGASVQCEGRCEGEVTPPDVKAECQATVDAKADASVECFPPSLEVTWQWNGNVDVTTQAEFKAWLKGFKGHVGVMLAARAKADILVEALGNLETAGRAAIETAGEGLADGDFVATYKIASCGLPELENVGTALGGASSNLEASVSSSIEIFGAVGL